MIWLHPHKVDEIKFLRADTALGKVISTVAGKGHGQGLSQGLELVSQGLELVSQGL
jgi:hypothetical protein